MEKKRTTKACCVFNYAPHYRRAIYQAMARELCCDFFFGDTVFQPIEQFDTTGLKGFKGFIKAKKTPFAGHVWHSGIKRIFNKEYTHYILTGHPKDIVNWLVILYAKFTGKKVYLWSHGLYAPCRGFFKRAYHKLFYASATGLLMYNRHNCRFMEEIGCRKERLHIMHNSLDTALQTEIYNSLSPESIYSDHFGNNHPTVIYIGRIQKIKKIPQLLQAAKILQQQGTPVNVVLVGGGNKQEIEQEIDALQLQGNAWLHGPCYDEATNARLLYNAAVCVSPGNVGLTAIHALTYGTPVVTHNNFTTQMPEAEAITDGVTGSLFSEDNVHDLARKIAHWCDITPAQRSHCRAAARHTIESEWSTGYQINLLKEIITE